jgi:hypothetical protein
MKYFASLFATPHFHFVFHHSFRAVGPNLSPSFRPYKPEAGPESSRNRRPSFQYAIIQMEDVCQKQHNLCVTINTHIHTNSTNI